MRIARRLSRPATGRWSFVQRVPVELRVVLDFRLIKRNLRTKDLAQATCVRSSFSSAVLDSSHS
ncbi:MAG: phage-related integrase [Stenotrophomonas rhizophila]|jgi:hypothetical protein|uniref:DUF6538 domain-containing protein n=1 Tax=Stenotrophomonas rhizophila TaxID=216778 RepID=UPI00201D1A02|nr:DUF6538 domain-containing protein [Stenotrophomonas rhizophila]MDF2816107.1 phage-related integrase [Stenotrophomonas rhizophila]UQY86169.1 hypothetical protein LQE85_11700 [Stenotrophomonas rhizophila]